MKVKDHVRWGHEGAARLVVLEGNGTPRSLPLNGLS